MSDHSLPNSKPLQESTPEIDEIEGLLRTYRPNPGQRLYTQVATSDWLKPTDTFTYPGAKRHISIRPNKLSLRWALSFIPVLLIFTLVLLTPLGSSLAQSVTRFFQIAPSDHMTEVISLTPYPTSEERSIYDLHSLSASQAEKLAGFKVKTLAELPSRRWRFHGAEYDAENQRVSLFYSLPSIYGTPMDPVEDIILFISEQRSAFKDYYRLCPNVTITEVDINSWPAELADGGVWGAEMPPTPETPQEYECKPVAAGEAMILRWEETDLKYEITVVQFAEDTSVWLSHADLLNLAGNMK
jgi:hypothetical protein